MIECDLPDSDVMLSDYDAWHIALNHSYLELTAEELESYLADRQRYDRQPTQERLDDLRQRYYRSWERIIDMHELTEPDWHPMQKKSVQACFWELKLTDVKSAKQFSAKARQA